MDRQTWRRQETLFASMRARLERQRVKTGTVKWSVTVLLFRHVNAVLTGNSNYQYSSVQHMCWETSGVSIFRLPHCWLRVNMHPEGRYCDRPTARLVTGFLASSVLQTNAVTVPKIPSCCCMISVQPSQFKLIKMSLFKVHKFLLQILRFSFNQKSEFRGPYCIPLLLTILTYDFNFHAVPIRRTSRRNLLTRWCSFFLKLFSCFSPFS